MSVQADARRPRANIEGAAGSDLSTLEAKLLNAAKSENQGVEGKAAAAVFPATMRGGILVGVVPGTVTNAGHCAPVWSATE